MVLLGQKSLKCCLTAASTFHGYINQRLYYDQYPPQNKQSNHYVNMSQCNLYQQHKLNTLHLSYFQWNLLMQILHHP